MPKSQSQQVIVNDKGCLCWQGAKDGYGRPLISRHGKVYRLQHEVFEKNKGFRARQIVMTCHNPNCLNPEHMEEVVGKQYIKFFKEKENEKAKKIADRISYLRAAIPSIEGDGPEETLARSSLSRELAELIKQPSSQQSQPPLPKPATMVEIPTPPSDPPPGMTEGETLLDSALKRAQDEIKARNQSNLK